MWTDLRLVVAGFRRPARRRWHPVHRLAAVPDPSAGAAEVPVARSPGLSHHRLPSRMPDRGAGPSVACARPCCWRSPTSGAGGSTASRCWASTRSAPAATTGVPPERIALVRDGSPVVVHRQRRRRALAGGTRRRPACCSTPATTAWRTRSRRSPRAMRAIIVRARGRVRLWLSATGAGADDLARRLDGAGPAVPPFAAGAARAAGRPAARARCASRDAEGCVSSASSCRRRSMPASIPVGQPCSSAAPSRMSIFSLARPRQAIGACRAEMSRGLPRRLSRSPTAPIAPAVKKVRLPN